MGPGLYYTRQNTGHPYDGALNLYYAHNRFYDAQTGRWLSEDPVEDGLNWYAYCNNNPVSYVDVLGLSVEDPEAGYYYAMEGSKGTEVPNLLKQNQEFQWKMSFYVTQKTIQGVQKGISFTQGMAVGTLENVKDMVAAPVNYLLLPYNISQNQDVRFLDSRDLIEGLANGTYNQTAFYEGMVTADVGCMISGFGLGFVFGGTTTALDSAYVVSVPLSGGVTGVAAPVVAEVSVAGIAATALSIEFGVVSGVNLLEDLGRVTESRGTESLGDKGGSETKTITSQSQMQKQVEQGQAPKDIDRVDKPHVPGQQPHVHFKDGTSLNQDGTIHDAHKGIPSVSNKVREWLIKNGWEMKE